jgi:protein-tyrosine phosphatase
VALLALGLAATSAHAQCEGDGAPTSVPFTDAVAFGVAGAQLLRWNAPCAQSVRVYAVSAAPTVGAPTLVGSGRGVDTILVPSAVDVASQFMLVPDRGAPLVIADRILGVTTAPNLRDLGGYRTDDGRWVRMRTVYRSDQLNLLDQDGMRRLLGLRVGAIVDLRVERERIAEPDPPAPPAEHVVADVLAEAGVDADLLPPGAMQRIAAGDGADVMRDLYRRMVASPSARRSYATLMREAANRDSGVVFHCTAGMDRTGWGAAVLLTALGVPRETVIRDYLLSRPLLADKHRPVVREVATQWSASGVSEEDIEPLYGARREYLEEAFAEVDRRFGSFDAYLTVGLGLRREELDLLRARLLVGAPARGASSNADHRH